MELSFAGYIGVGIVSSAVFLLVVFLLVARYATGTQNQRTYKKIPNRNYHLQTQLTYNLPRPQPVVSSKSVYNCRKAYQPSVLYHGTSRKNAFEIYNTGLWLIGNSTPPAVWMADNIELVQNYSGINSDGALVLIHVDADLDIENRGGGVFIYQIPSAVPNQEYYKIEGLEPAGILDTNGNRIN
jgi:hypothetical protein